MLECASNTEIVVHDNLNRLASLMYYEGDSANKITIGRDMGWGAISSVAINGNIIGSGTALTNLNYNAITNKPDLTVYTPKETSERQYPPKIWDTIDASYTTITHNGFEAYKINYAITAASYGLGSYSVAYSNRFVINGVYYNGSQTNNLFDYITIQDNTAGTGNLYNNGIVGFNSSGNYIGQRYLAETSYKGEWFYIRLPYQIKLTKYTIIGLVGPGNVFIVRSPALWKMYGSNDGMNWEEIIDASNSTTKLTTTDYINVSSKYTKILNNPSKSYSYIGMCINGIVSGFELQFVELQLFGIENNNFQSDWNSTIINKPDLTVYATNTNLNSISSSSTLSINNLNWSMLYQNQ